MGSNCPAQTGGAPGYGRDHLLHDGQTFFFEEHVLGAAEADALCAVDAGLVCILRIVGIGPDAQLSNVIGPLQQRLQLDLMFEIRILGIQLTEEDFTGAAIDAQPVTLMHLDRGCRQRWPQRDDGQRQ